MKVRIVAFIACSVLSAGFAIPVAAQATCAPGEHSGGDWPSFGRDAFHTRHQPHEDQITPGGAATLRPAWRWTIAASQGSFSGTPVVAEGCVYVGSQTGWVYGINADTGDLVWMTQVEENPDVPLSSGGAGINSSVSVADGVVYASVTTYEAPYVAALDAATGELLWTATIEAQAGAGTHTSPLVVDGLVVAGWDTAGVEFDPVARRTAYGGFVIIDAVSGDVLKRTYTIPPEDRDDGYSGGNIWSSFAAEPDTGYAFVGTAAPYSPAYEHPRTNAIIKVDIDRDRPTFGEIVASYKGVPDHFLQTQESVPCVPLAAGSNFAEGTGPCQKLDLDFAAAPNIFIDSQGRTIVGELQKAGVYHFVDAETMTGLHDVVVGNMALGYAPTNMGSTTFDGQAIYGAAGSSSGVFALDRDTADFRWRSTSVDWPLHVNPLASANGVIYMLNSITPVLMAYDARTGFPLPTVQAPAGMGTGVSVARNAIFAAGGNEIAAYQPDPARAAEAAMWDQFLSTIPSPPTTPHVDKPLL